MSSVPQPPRTYNQNHAPRKYIPGKRRVSIYWTWSYPWEANRDTAELDNRFSTMTEVRRVAWPAYEGTEWDQMHFLQGIAGTLELFHRSTLAFQRVVGEVTGQSVAVFQRIDQAGYKLPIDERILAQDDDHRGPGAVSRSSWPGLSRPSTPYFGAKAWMPGTRPGMTEES